MPTISPSCRHCSCADGCCAKNRLLNACVRLLLSSECGAVTARRLAEEAEVNHALIAYHFGSMSKLTDAAVQHVEKQLHIELVPEITAFTTSLATATPDTMRLAFEDACTRLVDFLLIRAPQMDVSRCLLEHRTSTHKLYPLYLSLMIKPVMKALSAFILLVWSASNTTHSTQEVFVLATLMLSQLLFPAQMASDPAFAEKTLQGFTVIDDSERAVRQIVCSLQITLGLSQA